MKSLETIILQNLIQNEEYVRKVIPFFDNRYFQNEHSVCFNAINSYFRKYNTKPSKDAVGVFISETEKNETTAEKSILLLDQIYDPIDKESSELPWLLDQTEKWCKDRAITLAVIDSVEIIKDPKKNRGVIPELMQKALAVSFDNNIGHDYFNDAQKRYDFYTGKGSTLEKIPFLLERLNYITDGGAETKSLNVLLGGTGGGKTMSMCSLASDYLRQGYDVLYFTMEMADQKIAQRIDANLMNVDMNDIKHLGEKVFVDGLKSIHSKTDGRIFIKEYPMCTPTSDHFRAFLDELLRKKKFDPKIIFIDYLNICHTLRYKPSDKYDYVKAIAEDMRSLGQERNKMIWTATQTNRDGFKKSDLDADNTSESFGIPFTADFMLSIFADDNMKKMGKLKFQQASKNRYDDITKLNYFFVGCNRARQQLYNLEN